MWFGLSAIGFVTATLLHAIFARMGGSLTIVLSFLCISAPIAALIALVALWLFGVSDDAIAAFLVYLAACEVYIFLFTLAANGVSVSLMMRLEARRKPPVSTAGATLLRAHDEARDRRLVCLR